MACDKYHGDVDATEILSETEYRGGTIARLMSSGLYHSTAASVDNILDGTEDSGWLDIGEDTEVYIQEALKTLIEDSKSET